MYIIILLHVAKVVLSLLQKWWVDYYIYIHNYIGAYNVYYNYCMYTKINNNTVTVRETLPT